MYIFALLFCACLTLKRPLSDREEHNVRHMMSRSAASASQELSGNIIFREKTRAERPERRLRFGKCSIAQLVRLAEAIHTSSTTSSVTAWM